jgi:hypothetical protein
MEGVPGEIVAMLGGLAMYLAIYFFGWGARPGLRKQKASAGFGAGLIGLGLAVMVMALIAAHQTGTPVRSLDDHRELPEFVRNGYWFSIVLMSTGACELLRAWLAGGRGRGGALR